MSTIRRVALIVAAVSFIGFRFAKKANAPSVAVSENAKFAFPIRTPIRKDCAVTPYVIAERLGFLTQEGLRLQWTAETQSALLLPSILAGDNDTADLHPNAIALARAGGAPVSAVAEAAIEPGPQVDPRYRHLAWFINPQKLPHVASLADVAQTITNRRIRLTTSTPNVGTDFEGKLLATRYGIAHHRFEWISMPDGPALGALKLGLVDVAAVHPPFYEEMHRTGAKQIADSSDTGLGPAGGATFWVFHDQFISRHPDKVAAWVRALRRAQIWANANPEGARRFTSEAIRLPVTWNIYYSENPDVDSSLLVPWLEDLVQSGIISAGKLTASSIVNQQIAERNKSIFRERDLAAAGP